MSPARQAPAPNCEPDVVRVAKAVGDPLRAGILKVLAEDSFSVLELCEIFHMAQPAISHHLKLLSEAGLVNRRKEGTSVFYQRAPAYARPLLNALFDALDNTGLPDAEKRRIDTIYKTRQQRSTDFFAHHADALSQQEQLICAASVYRDAVLQSALQQPALKRRSALEVGPGDGALLKSLAQHYKQVTGIDNSAQVLAKTRQAAGQTGNIRLLEKDFLTLAPRRQFDLVVAAMVVHHLPSPARFFEQAAQVLKAGGMLIVVELCPHDQEWVRANCGDQWLGFAPETLRHWPEQFGLTATSTQFLAQRNGFRVQVVTAMLHRTSSSTQTSSTDTSKTHKGTPA